MNAVKTPCNDCPFRKNSLAGWLATYTPLQLHSLVMNEVSFPCHLTHDTDLDFDESEDYPLCAGALRYMKKNAKSPRNSELNKMVKNITDKDCENILSTCEFFEHHTLNKPQSKRKRIINAHVSFGRKIESYFNNTLFLFFNHLVNICNYGTRKLYS